MLWRIGTRSSAPPQTISRPPQQQERPTWRELDGPPVQGTFFLPLASSPECSKIFLRGVARRVAVSAEGAHKSGVDGKLSTAEEWEVKYKFIKNHFHQKPISSKTHFHQKTTFIKKQFHQRPLSSKTTSIKNQLHQRPFSSETTSCQRDPGLGGGGGARGRPRPPPPPPPPAEQKQHGSCSPLGSQPAFLLNIAAEGRQCSAERPAEGPKVGVQVLGFRF